jgi:hypothetical protein
MVWYGYGWYLLTPREQTAVASPLAGVTLSVPDVYSFRSGVSTPPWRKRGISASLGPRLDGIPLRDFVGAAADSAGLDIVFTSSRESWCLPAPPGGFLVLTANLAVPGPQMNRKSSSRSPECINSSCRPMFYLCVSVSQR